MAGPISLKGVHLTGRDRDSLWDVECIHGSIQSIVAHSSKIAGVEDIDGRFLTPSLCHPHIHLDKCFLLSHPKYSDLEIITGNFQEALQLTSKAKSRFERGDLLERGRALIQESVTYGVTHMRAFVEVDEVVGMKCLEAGLILKEEFKTRCHVQICAFAQDPIFTYDDGGKAMKMLMEEAAATLGVDVVGSTPYVEKNMELQKLNIEWMIDLASKHSLHVDYHLDYNLNANVEPMVHHVVQELKSKAWPKHKSVTLGHCTRLTLFDNEQWKRLRDEIGPLPVSFVGLPTSDMFMMGRPTDPDEGGSRPRGTLNVPEMIRKYGFDAAIGINNVGNAFTPQGSCDCLSVACLGIGVYQVGTKKDADCIFECVSTRAKTAIGLGSRKDLSLKPGDPADLIAFGRPGGEHARGFRHPTTVQELVYDATRDRMTIFGGRITSGL